MSQKILLSCLALLCFSFHSVPANGQDGKIETLSKLKKLMIERRDTLKELVKYYEAAIQTGRVELFFLYDAQDRLLDAELELEVRIEQRIEFLEKRVDLRRKVEDESKRRSKSGIAPPNDLLDATAARLKAEIELEREKQKLNKNPCK